MFYLFVVQWGMPKGVVERLAAWQGNFGRCSDIAIWNVIPYCLMWGIWREGNARILKSVYVCSFY